MKTQKYWQEGEDDELRRLFHDGLSWNEMATAMGRTPRSVQSRCERIGLSKLAVVRSAKAICDRFWAKVDKSGECWEWTGTTDHGGYGIFPVGVKGRDRRKVGAHRWSYEQEYGPITSDQWVLHECDNPRCVRPDHLFLGNAFINTMDARIKGRNKTPSEHATPEGFVTAKEAAAVTGYCYQHMLRKIRRGTISGNRENGRWLVPVTETSSVAALLSIKEAAALLGCSTDTIRRRLKAGTLRYTRTGPGGHYRIHRDALLAWVPEPRPRTPRPVKGEAAGWVRELHPYARA